MIKFITLLDVLEIHRRVLAQSGGGEGILNQNMLESALAQPLMSFGGQAMYPEISDKTAALGFSLIKNHCFVDGNKRVSLVAMDTFLVLNGFEISAPVDEAEKVISRGCHR